MVAAVVSEVGFFASIATVESPAQRRCAAAKDSPHRPVMGGGEMGAVALGVIFPMLRKDVCQIQGHGFPCR